MRNMKYVSSAGLAIAIFLVTTAYLNTKKNRDVGRNPSSVSDRYSEDIKILNSIPLMSPIERPESDEPEIADTLIAIFNRFADHNRNSDGTLNRGTHAKGVCFTGKFHIYNQEELKSYFGYDQAMIQRLKQGLFTEEGDFPVVMRFANADGLGRKQADTVPDVRGFSFTVQTPPSIKDYTGASRQDFMFNSTLAFATGGIHEFLELVKAANIAIYHDFTFVPNFLYIPAIVGALSKLQKGNSSGSNTKSLASQEYWDNLPYSHGINANGLPVDIVKYKAAPCDGNGTQRLPSVNGLDPNYLQKDIEERAKNGSVCFHLQVQFFDIKKLQAANIEGAKPDWTVTDWVENGGLGWEENVLPYHNIAVVEIPTRFGVSPKIPCDNQYINTRLHSNRANQPLGSIARVRTLVEETSRARRMGEINSNNSH